MRDRSTLGPVIPRSVTLRNKLINGAEPIMDIHTGAQLPKQ